jgi:KUP system potassium uptake protein
MSTTHAPAHAAQPAELPVGRKVHETKRSTAALALLALGIVYGDIGTSPLYAVKETFAPGHGIDLTTANVLGGLSTIFWSLMIVVSLKYVTLIMRADNRGEGGIMALVALASAATRSHPEWRKPVLLGGVIGASLFYGDAVLTPAISVLSAVEGLQVGAPALKPYVLPMAVGVLIALFAFQRRGTGAVGALFGPVTLLWFLSLAAAGVYGIAGNPAVLGALNPWHAYEFFHSHVLVSFVVLGSVVLAVTGAEALYADMGHFGRGPIRLAWFGLVLPALVLNYFGQGALLLEAPLAAENPFYLLVPGWAHYPMVALATVATVVASQATISGAYSITKQAIQLGFLPRMNIVHTSAAAMGQVYIPAINWILLAAVLAAVVGFGTSSELASAYGVAVTATMLVDTLLTFVVIRYSWHYPLALCIAATGFFLVVDLAFLSSTLLKITDGGWFPLVIGALVSVLMVTWRGGRELLLERLRTSSVPLGSFLNSLFLEPPQRVPGTAVFLTATPDATPHALLHSLKHYRVLHERNVFLTVEFRDVPWVLFKNRIQCEALGHECWRVVVRYGFMNRPDVGDALELCGPAGLQLDPREVSYFLSREKIVPAFTAKSALLRWRDRIFSTMARNAGTVTDFFNIPPNRVVELGTRVEI